jgi:hypothetical protein
MEKTIDVNIVAGVRQSASLIGALLGKAYSTVESKTIWQGGQEGFERDKAAANATNSAMLITNRSPKKYSLKTQDIISAQFYVQPITGQQGIVINLRQDGKYDMFFPLDGHNPIAVEKPVADAISDALKGEGENFFLDPKTVAAVINEANKAEIKNIETLITSLSKMKQNLQGAVVENEKKAAEIEKQWIDSKVNGIDIKTVMNSGTATLNVHTTTEE